MLVGVCLAFFTLVDYVGLVKYAPVAVTLHVRCEVKSTSFIDDIPYQYLRFSVKMEISIVGKLSMKQILDRRKKYIQLLHA